MTICSDQEFIELWHKNPSPNKMSKILNMDLRGVYRRRNNIQEKLNIELNTIDLNQLEKRLTETRHSVRRGIEIQNGRVIVFSDAHFMPNDESTAFRALLRCIKEFKPDVIVANGDLFDGSTNSKYPRIGWDTKPTVNEELEAVKWHLEQIEQATTFKSNLIWTLGNHDARFETYLAANVPQYEGVSGFALKDHFPLWQPCYSYWVNDDTIIKHRFKGGRYAGYNNALATLGKHMVTGHTHVLAVQPISAYQKTIYGVQTGCLANVDGDAFVDYTEDGPKDWRAGFVMLTFHKGQLLLPEMIQVYDESNGQVQFRGKVYNV